MIIIQEAVSILNAHGYDRRANSKALIITFHNF